MTATIHPFHPRKPAPVQAQGDECQCSDCVRPRWQPRNQCAMSVMCAGVPADRGLMCAAHRAQDNQTQRRFSDDVDPMAREEMA